MEVNDRQRNRAIEIQKHDPGPLEKLKGLPESPPR
jgi:hypothetical protein